MRVQSSEEKKKVSTYRDLHVWQKARILVKRVYALSKAFPKEEIYGLTSQWRRAAVSLVSNLAEGSSKRSTKEFIRFINISYGSLAELEAQAIIAGDLEYLSTQYVTEILQMTAEIGRMLNALQNGLQKKLNPESRTLNSELLDS